MPPPNIVDYAASKAGIQALGLELPFLHNAPRVRMANCILNFARTPLLVGKLRQPQFLTPTLYVETVSEAIVDALYSGYGGMLYMPGMMRFGTALVRSAYRDLEPPS